MHNPVGISAKAANILFDPAQSRDLIQKPVIAADAMLRLPAQLRMGQKAQSAQPVIDTDHKYAFCCQGPSMVEFLIPQTSLETAAVNPKQHRQFFFR